MTETTHAMRFDQDNNPFFPGLQCAWFRSGEVFLTDTWWEELSASGNATVTCPFKDD